MKRIVALIGVIALVACVFLTLYFALIGSKYFMGMLFLTIMLPILLWVYLYIYKLLKDKPK